jgi:hypothetical protein
MSLRKSVDKNSQTAINGKMFQTNAKILTSEQQATNKLVAETRNRKI